MTYDPKVDAFAIRLTDGHSSDCEEIEPGVVLDYDESGRIIGIEILDFKEHLAKAEEELTRGLVAGAAATE
jgi:uncharacterized protein YuzE